MPVWLAEFDVSDWYVRDPDDELEVRYARIQWATARRVWTEGGDAEAHRQPPSWWASDSPDPYPGPTSTRPRSEQAAQGLPCPPPRVVRARPIKSR
ncbi:hypothetical protein SSBG_02572 [Streptomyces sp. SPB074]|nr:hypothetical protein SSBG_02572 [Streptomyces sp. SPB074]